MNNPVSPFVGVDLSQYQLVFCDSGVALEAAYQHGLSRSAKIITQAPAVALRYRDVAVALEPDDQADKREALSFSLRAFSEAVYDACRRDTDTARFAVLAARQSLLILRDVSKLLSLNDGDFTQPRLQLGVATGNPLIDDAAQGPLATMLQYNPRFRQVFIPQIVSETFTEGRPPLIDWFNNASWEAFAYRLLTRFCRKAKDSSVKPKAFVVSANDLTIETGYYLWQEGFEVVPMALPPLQRENTDLAKNQANVAQVLWAPVHDFLSQWLLPQCADGLTEKFLQAVGSEMTTQVAATTAWAKVFGQKAKAGKDVILVNFPGSAVFLGLGDWCRESGVSMAAFEHGVSREICRFNQELAAQFENAVADLTFTYNDEATKVTKASPFGEGAVQTVGMPKVLRHMSKWRPGSAGQVLFVSTALYSGNVNHTNGSLTDIGRCQREIDIIDKVLSKLPHNVCYKTYPSRRRYADPDPIIECLRLSPVRVYDKAVNLRFFAARFDIIVTSRATSTLSVCLLAGRPVVFIDMPDHAALREDLRDLMQDSLFYFRWDGEETLNSLRDFLSKPRDELQALWEAKHLKRAELLERHFTGPEGVAGRKASKAICDWLDQAVDD